MTRRFISESQRAWLVAALDDWRSLGLLSEDQAGPILDLYETQTELAERKHSLALLTLMAIAALMFGLGALLLIGYNWQAMPAALKLVIIFSVILGTHGLGLYLRFQRQAAILSEVAFFLGCLFYGAGIFLIGQIFHMNAHYPLAFWWWAWGILPFAICLDTMLLHLLLVAVLAIWSGSEILGFPHLGLWFFGRWGMLPNGAYSLLLMVLPGILWAYRRGSVAALSLYVPLVAWWVVLQPFAWGFDLNPVYFIGGVGGLLLVLGECHDNGSRFAIPYRLFGVLLAAGVLIPLSFYEFNDDVSSLEITGSVVQIGVVAALAVVAVGIAEGRRRQRLDIDSVKSSGSSLRRQLLPFGVIALMAFLLFWQTAVQEALLPTLVSNLAMIALSFWLIGIGLREDRGQPFAGGVIYFLLWTVLRYIDLFGDFGGMLGAAAMFFVCGGVLFGVALYWRNRRQQ